MSAAAALIFEPRADGRSVTTRSAVVPSSDTVVRSAGAGDVDAVYQMIAAHALEGRLLPRSRTDIAANIQRFVVATAGNRVLGCADLAPLSSSTAEVRSLVVDSSARANGIGRQLLKALTLSAKTAGFDTLCAFTHSPAYFVHVGFSLVPHTWLPEKIDRDCRNCPLFRHCDQSAVALPLVGAAIPHVVRVGSFNG